MPIEIRQLLIRARVEPPRPSASPAAGPPAAPLSAAAAQPPLALVAAEREAIVAACVREVLRELKKARER